MILHLQRPLSCICVQRGLKITGSWTQEDVWSLKTVRSRATVCDSHILRKEDQTQQRPGPGPSDPLLFTEASTEMDSVEGRYSWGTNRFNSDWKKNRKVIFSQHFQHSLCLNRPIKHETGHSAEAACSSYLFPALRHRLEKRVMRKGAVLDMMNKKTLGVRSREDKWDGKLFCLAAPTHLHLWVKQEGWR